ncbi:hypothetical protein CMI37_18610 [Candidatus Pacearchaeota archaeon]|nr:hypothetical protein [Candidatus Pacearchaeota archaeon]
MGLYSSKPPKPPDFEAATRAGVEADIESLPIRKLIEAAARQGTKVTYTDMDGKEQTVDFTGFGDVDMSRQDLEFAEESADRMAQAMLSVQEKYGADFVKQRLKELELADPQFRKVRESLGEAALEDVESGYALAPGMREEVQQATRAAQYARGNVFGAAPAAEEAFEVGNAAFRLRQQRLANAASYLSGTTPVAQFGQIAGAQQGAAGFNPMGVRSGIGLDPNAGARSLGLATNVYNNQFQDYMQQSSMAGDMLGAVAGLGMGAMTGGLLGAIGGGGWKGFSKGARKGIGGGGDT